MAKVIAGAGRKRPQINISVDLLDLDPRNPRLADEAKRSSQFDLLKILYEQFNLEELAYSMTENGYFDEEPIVIVPQKLPANFSFANVEKAEEQLQDLVSKGKIRFHVIEGNRRTATLKILLQDEFRRKLKVDTDFPNANKSIIKELSVIPAIVYEKREDISAYLGVRHIAGLLKWEAYAKAVYLAKRIEQNKNIEAGLKEVQRQTADRTDVIRKQYLCYRVLKEAEDNLNFDIETIKDRFSLIQVALNSPSIRQFVGIESHKNVDFGKALIPLKKQDHLEKLLSWIFGKGKEKQPILTDSRKITSRLAPVLADKDATEYLIKYDNLEEAYERSGGEKKFLEKKINDATKNLRNALGIAYKYKTPDIIQLIDECIEAATVLKMTIKK